MATVPASRVPASRHLLRAKDLIDARYRDPLDVPVLADAARLSLAHFSREFRRAFGETPHQYLPTCRLALALDGSQRRRHLLHRRLEQRRVVHHELRQDVRVHADRLPRSASAGHDTRPHPDLRAPGVGAAAIQQFSRRQRGTV